MILQKMENQSKKAFISGFKVQKSKKNEKCRKNSKKVLTLV